MFSKLRKGAIKRAKARAASPEATAALEAAGQALTEPAGPFAGCAIVALSPIPGSKNLGISIRREKITDGQMIFASRELLVVALSQAAESAERTGNAKYAALCKNKIPLFAADIDAFVLELSKLVPPKK